MKWFVGTSGFSYAQWKGKFYPKELPAREWLSFYARHFDAVEINTSFYHLPKAQQVADWYARTPAGFTFAFKGSRYITHNKRLLDPAETVPPFMAIMKARPRGGPIIFQLPPRFPKDDARLAAFLDALPKRKRYAVEFRDPSWHEEDIYALLRRRNIAFCLFEKGPLRAPRVATANFSYVRLHGRIEGYRGNYDKGALADWHRWLAAQKADAYVFFDNTTQKIYALDNARDFRAMTL